MAFESLSERLNKAIKNISGQGKLTEKNMNEMLKEVRLSLLEADVNYNVVKEFVENVKEKALGQEVMDSLNPGQMVVKIVHDEIVALLGDGDNELNLTSFSTIMLVGLQGTGKTTAAAKIANVLKKKKGKKHNIQTFAAWITTPITIRAKNRNLSKQDIQAPQITRHIICIRSPAGATLTLKTRDMTETFNSNQKLLE